MTTDLNTDITAAAELEVNETIANLTANDFDKFYAKWTDAVAASGVSFDPLFQTVRIEAANPVAGGKADIHWWGAASVEGNVAKLQRVQDGIVTTMGEHDHCVRHHGIRETLEYLFQFRNDPKAVAAVLTAASLRARLFAACDGFVAVAEDFAAQEAFNQMSWIYEAAINYLRGIDADFTGWWPTLKIALPEPVGARPAIADLATVLVAEQAALLKNWVPVVAEPVLSETRQAEVAGKTGHRSATWYAGRRSKAAVRYAAEREERLANSASRTDKWSSLTKEDLERLVWTKATRLVAKDYGVSDVAFAKRCRKEGVSKPPRGFWRKVEKGYIAHPNGVRPGNDVLQAA